MNLDPVLDAALERLGYPYDANATLAARELNCSVLVDAIVRRVYPRARLSARDMMIGDLERPWSAIDALVASGVATRAGDIPPARQWAVCQGWRRLDQAGHVTPGRSRGHTWLWWADEDGSRILEATSASRPWWRRQVWAEQVAPYDEVRVCALVSQP